MKLWHRRFAATLWEDPTRQIQALGTLVAFTVAFVLIRFQTPADPKTARAVFYLVGDRTFAAILLVAGLLQLLAFPGPWWRLRATAAVIKLAVWSYAAGCYLLTNPSLMSGWLLLDFAVAEGFVAYRAVHDREINGTDRRLYTGTGA